MTQLNFPYFEPPSPAVELDLYAAKMLQSINNCAQQMAARERCLVVTPTHVWAAMRVVINAAISPQSIPSGLHHDAITRKRTPFNE